MKHLTAIIIAALFTVATLSIGCGKKDDDEQAMTAQKDDSAKKGKVDPGAPSDKVERAHRNPAPPDSDQSGDKDGLEEPAGNPKAGDPKATAGDVEAQKLLAEFGPKVEAFMQTLVDTVEASGGDCAKLAPPIIELLGENADLLAKMAAADKTAAAATWQREHAGLMKAFGMKMAEVGKCAAEDPKLVEAIQALPR